MAPLENASGRSRRIMILGFDGATLDLIRPWAEAGILPTFKRLMSEGAWGNLRSIMPPVTPASWTAMATGMNQGKHGLFDFFQRDGHGLDSVPVKASDRHGDTLWNLLSAAGYRVTVFNVPASYPPDHTNGLMISGLLTPADAKDASWPPQLQQELQAAVPEFNFAPPGIYSKGQDLEFVQAVHALNLTTLKATRWLMARQPWDFFCSIFMGTDIISHFMWRNMETGAANAPAAFRPRLTNAIQDCYRDMDDAVAQLLDELGPQTDVIIMSDHGFGAMQKYMTVNAWLIERGYIQFKRSRLSQLRYRLYRLGFTPLNVYGLLRKLRFGGTMRRSIRKNAGAMKQANRGLFLSFADVDWSRTTAYSDGHAGPIFVNLKGREPHGVVSPGREYEAVVNRLIVDLQSLKEPGTDLPFVGEIHRGHELYSGDHAAQAPDLLFFPRDWKYAGLGLVEFPTNQWLAASPDRSGNHRMNGMVFAAGPDIEKGRELKDASILDIAPTVLGLMGLPIPENMDGQILVSALTPEARGELSQASRTIRREVDRLPLPDVASKV